MEKKPDDAVPPESEEDLALTTEALVAEVHANRIGEPYPDAQRLLENLPVLLRGLCDFVLTGKATAYEVARVLAALIDAVDHVQEATETIPKPEQRRH